MTPALGSTQVLSESLALYADNHVGSQRARFPEKPQGNLFLILERFPQNRLRRGLRTENAAGGCRQRRWPRFLVGGPRAKSDLDHQLVAIVTSLGELPEQPSSHDFGSRLAETGEAIADELPLYL